jgi:hypothetical protein
MVSVETTSTSSVTWSMEAVPAPAARMVNLAYAVNEMSATDAAARPMMLRNSV